MIWTKNFTELSNEEILTIYKARTDPRTTQFCLNNNFSFDNHQNFIHSLKFRDDAIYLIVYNDNDFIGVVSFNNFENKSSEFGMYKNPKVTGVGSTLMEVILNYAKNNLHLQSIIAKVLKHNAKALGLYLKFGFKQYFDDEKFIFLRLDI